MWIKPRRVNEIMIILTDRHSMSTGKSDDLLIIETVAKMSMYVESVLRKMVPHAVKDLGRNIISAMDFSYRSS
jgi:hypothetical protein